MVISRLQPKHILTKKKTTAMPKSVLFVCSENRCASPMAEAIFREQLKEIGQLRSWLVDSAGVSAFYVGSKPDKRTLQTLKRHKIKDYKHTVRQINAKDLKDFGYILVMKNEDLNHVLCMLDANDGNPKVKLLGSCDEAATADGVQIHDLHYSLYDADFERAFKKCWKCCSDFLKTAY